MRSRQPQPLQFVSRAGVVGLAPEGAWGKPSHWLALAKEGSAQLFSFATSRRSSAAKALPGSSVQGISVAKGQRLPALSCRVGGAASPRGASTQRLSGHQNPVAFSLATHQAFSNALPANITVKAVPFGHWTSRKRAAPYLQR